MLFSNSWSPLFSALHISVLLHPCNKKLTNSVEKQAMVGIIVWKIQKYTPERFQHLSLIICGCGSNSLSSSKVTWAREASWTVTLGSLLSPIFFFANLIFLLFPTMRSLVPGYLKGPNLHNCRSISQAWPTRHFARDERVSRGEGRRKDHHPTKYKVHMTRNFFTILSLQLYVFNHFGSSKMFPLSIFLLQ